LVATLATLPSMSLIPSAPLKLVRCPHSLAPTLVALPSNVADPISSIPDLWHQVAVRALQQGKDPPPPIQPSQPLRRSRRLWRDKRGGAGTDRIGQDLHQSTSAMRDQ